MPRFGPVFDAKTPREKVYVGPFFAFFSQEMRHMNSFWGFKMGHFGWGAKKFMLEKFIVLFCPL